jgi:hypothetical protein
VVVIRSSTQEDRAHGQKQVQLYDNQTKKAHSSNKEGRKTPQGDKGQTQQNNV